MSILAAMLPITAAAKVASSLFSRRHQAPASSDFQQMLEQTLGAKIIEQRDRDGDGLLSLEEFGGHPSRFANWDANEDGKLSAAEIDTGVALNRRWLKLDTDADDALTQHELGINPRPFGTIDANHDQRVSRAEYFRAYHGGLPS